MIKNLILLLVVVAGTLGLSLVSPTAVRAECNSTDTASTIDCGVDSAAGKNQPSDDPSSTISSTIAAGIKVLSFIVGVVAVIMLMVGGLRFITSGSNAEGAKAARNTILYALIGLVVAALAQLLVHFVLNKTNDATKSGKQPSSYIQSKPNQLTKA